MSHGWLEFFVENFSVCEKVAQEKCELLECFIFLAEFNTSFDKVLVKSSPTDFGVFEGAESKVFIPFIDSAIVTSVGGKVKISSVWAC